MNTTTDVTVTEPTVDTLPESMAVVKTAGNNFELSATNPEEMVECHRSAIEWAKGKIAATKAEADELVVDVNELTAAYEHAKKCKWRWDVLFAQMNKAVKRVDATLKRVEYYEKLLAAFEAGYYIVPNFEVTLFAIRTDKSRPARKWARLSYSNRGNFEQEAKVLPAGEGQYVNPQPDVAKDYGSEHKDEKTGVVTSGFEAIGWKALDFPANMARLHVMDAAKKAMDHKIFDEVGFLPEDWKRNPDPLLIGRIIDPRFSPYGKKRVSFIIAWHINTALL